MRTTSTRRPVPRVAAALLRTLLLAACGPPEETTQTLSLARDEHRLGQLAQTRGELGQAARRFERSLLIREKLAPGSDLVLESLDSLIDVTHRRGDLVLLKRYHRRNLELLEKRPDKLAWAEGLYRRAETGFLDLQSVAAARADLEIALKVAERLDPQSPRMARYLSRLARLARARGELEEAEGHFEHALQILEEEAPRGLDVALVLTNYAYLVLTRGDFAKAESYFRRALVIRQELLPESQEVADCYFGLADVATRRGDFAAAAAEFQNHVDLLEKLPDKIERAAGYFRRARLGLLGPGDPALAEADLKRTLALLKEAGASRLKQAQILVRLGRLVLRRGDVVAAEAYLSESLALREELAPESLAVADSLKYLGDLARQKADLAVAESCYRRSLAIHDRLAPNSYELGVRWLDLGHLAVQRGDAAAAETSFQKALSLFDTAAPGREEVVVALHELGKLSRQSGHAERAWELLDRAMTTQERQVGRLGASYDFRDIFRSRFQSLYQDAVQVLLELDRPGEAFHVLERSRARNLLVMLAERELLFAADIPEELERKRRRLAVRYDRVQREMASPDAVRDRERAEKLSRDLLVLRRELDVVEASIRRSSLALAELQYPQPLRLEDVVTTLDPETVLLSYSVGKEQTVLFVVSGAGDFRSIPLDVGEETLRRQVEVFRQLIPKALAPGDDLLRLHARGEQLYALLIEPAADWIEAGDRILLIPDGPLHLLPFGALVGGPANRRYLVEWKPLHSVLSATLYASLKKTRQRRANPDGSIEVVAFGDPDYPPRRDPARVADVQLRSAFERGLLDFSPLPYTRKEVEGIADLYDSGVVRAYLGADATEDRLKALGEGPRILHVAAHSRLDPRFPLNSFVALTLPQELDAERDNGLLQVWEIFERLRLPRTDLVVLSACQSALGEERGGEGLIGLTRAFQYAGGRSVAATLWKVRDRTTAELMVRFYRHLRRGKTKDEALRAAQLELIRGPVELVDDDGRRLQKDASAPYYWAAFQLYGDWRSTELPGISRSSRRSPN